MLKMFQYPQIKICCRRGGGGGGGGECLKTPILYTTSNFETTLNQRCSTSSQRCFNVDMKLSQCLFNLASTSVKVIWKPIWLVKSMDLLKD